MPTESTHDDMQSQRYSPHPERRQNILPICSPPAGGKHQNESQRQQRKDSPNNHIANTPCKPRCQSADKEGTEEEEIEEVHAHDTGTIPQQTQETRRKFRALSDTARPIRIYKLQFTSYKLSRVAQLCRAEFPNFSFVNPHFPLFHRTTWCFCMIKAHH